MLDETQTLHSLLTKLAVEFYSKYCFARDFGLSLRAVLLKDSLCKSFLVVADLNPSNQKLPYELTPLLSLLNGVFGQGDLS